jgi:hypothetical protein
MSESLRDLLQRGADAVERPRLDVSDLVARAERRLVRRRLATVAASAAAVALIAAGGFALQPDDERPAPAPPAPEETHEPLMLYYDAGEFVHDDGERNVVIPPGVYAVPFSGWGDLPPKVADLRAVITFPAGFMSRHRSTFADSGSGANQRELAFWTVDKVPTDFCGSGDRSRRFTNPGPTVADLATALATQPRLGGTDPVPVTIGGYDGLYVELTKPTDAPQCTGRWLWLVMPTPRSHTAYHEQFTDPGDVARIWILDVDGDRVVIDTIHPADASDEAVAELTRIVESATFRYLN